jgi:hypothetical protein
MHLFESALSSPCALLDGRQPAAAAMTDFQQLFCAAQAHVSVPLPVAG